MISTLHSPRQSVVLSIAIAAWNEEDAIGSMITSLFRQSIFRQLAARGEGCEIICVANACTDRTVAVAQNTLEKMLAEHPEYEGLTARVFDIPEQGKNIAWNRFVHEFSAVESRYMCFLDADINLNQQDTLATVMGALDREPHLQGASDCPCKAIADRAHPSLRERLSLAGSDMTDTTEGRLNGMLYILRTNIARNLYLPRDVIALDDGFLKAAICTDFFRAPVDLSKVVSVRGATHLYEPYLGLREFLNNQKRQMIGQTTVYVAVEYLKTLPESDRASLGATLQRNDTCDPDWLRRLIDAHLAQTRFFWQLFPGILGFRWRRLGKLRGIHRITHFPAATVGFVATLIACWRAWRFLRCGVSNYWPKAVRKQGESAANLQIGRAHV